LIVPTLDRVQREIEEFEGFSVEIKASKSKSDGVSVPSYKRKHERRARESHTVDDWKRLRFEVDYPGHAVDVLLGDGRKARGSTLLERVRRSYE